MGATFDPLLGRLRTTDAGGSGSGDVTHTGTLTAHEVILGNGGADIKALGAIGALGEVLTSGGAGVDPSWTAAGSGTIGGTIAATQVAFGTGADTIGGDADFTWIDPTLNFTSGKGLSFAGAGDPVTVVGGNDGDGNTAIIFDNPTDQYFTLQSNQSFSLTTGDADATGPDIDFNIGGVSTPGVLSVFPGGYSLGGLIESKVGNVVASGADYHQTSIGIYGLRDSVTSFWNANLFLGANTAGVSHIDPAYSFGAEGNFTALGAFTHYRAYLFDQVNDQTVWFIDDLTPNTFIFPSPINVLMASSLTVQGAIGTPALLPVNTTNGSALVLDAYDVDGAAYKTFLTLTNANTPTLVITPPSGGTVTLNATTLQQAGSTITLGGALTTSGAFGSTFTMTGTTTVTFPTSGTLLTTAGSGTSLTFPGTLSIASGKVLTASNTLTFTGTDSTSFAFPSSSDTVVTLAATQTLTTKRITKRTGTTASSATPTINSDTVDFYSITALATAITDMSTNLSGTPTNAQTLWLAITDDGTARGITWGGSFEASTVALPTTTVISTRLDVGFVWNTATTKWRCVATA